MVSALPPGHRGRLFSVALGPNNGPTPRSHGLHVATDISRMSPRLLRAAAMAVSIALATAVAPARAEVAAAPFDGERGDRHDDRAGCPRRLSWDHRPRGATPR